MKDLLKYLVLAVVLAAPFGVALAQDEAPDTNLNQPMEGEGEGGGERGGGD